MRERGKGLLTDAKVQSLLAKSYASLALFRQKTVEFQLCDATLRFMCPPASISLDKGSAQEFFIDERPFVNTGSKFKYVEYNEDYHFMDIYRSGWDIKKGLMSRSTLGDLQFSVRLMSLSDAGAKRFGDITDFENARVWLNDVYQRHMAIFGQVGLVPSCDQFFQVRVTDSKREKNEVCKKSTLRFSECQINDLPMLSVQSHINVMEYYYCYSESELILFNFEIGYNDANDEEENAMLLSMIDTKTSRLMSSVTYSNTV